MDKIKIQITQTIQHIRIDFDQESFVKGVRNKFKNYFFVIQLQIVFQSR